MLSAGGGCGAGFLLPDQPPPADVQVLLARADLSSAGASLLYLSWLGVDTAFRRRGIGGKMLSSLKARAARDGSRGIFVDVKAGGGAEGFYVSQGFEAAGVAAMPNLFYWAVPPLVSPLPPAAAVADFDAFETGRTGGCRVAAAAGSAGGRALARSPGSASCAFFQPVRRLALPGGSGGAYGAHSSFNRLSARGSFSACGSFSVRMPRANVVRFR